MPDPSTTCIIRLWIILYCFISWIYIRVFLAFFVSFIIFQLMVGVDCGRIVKTEVNNIHSWKCVGFFLSVGMYQSNEELSLVCVSLLPWLPSVHQRLYIFLEWTADTLCLWWKLRCQNVFVSVPAPRSLTFQQSLHTCSTEVVLFPVHVPPQQYMGVACFLVLCLCGGGGVGHDKEFSVVSDVVFHGLCAGSIEFLLLEWFLWAKVFFS